MTQTHKPDGLDAGAYEKAFAMFVRSYDSDDVTVEKTLKTYLAALPASSDGDYRSFAALIEEHILSIPTGALNALRNQTQLDADGVMVGVSREAVDEVLTGVNAAIHAYWNMPAALSKDTQVSGPYNTKDSQ